MDYRPEVVTLSVSDVEKATAFHTQQVGLHLDVDFGPTDAFRVVPLTPPGSAGALHLAVAGIEAADRELTERGVAVGGIRHKSPVGDRKGGWTAGPDPERRNHAGFADFSDPDGSTWTIQEIGYRPPA
ncbi:VOC family protein [Streptomyces sp. NPDC057616]|uniref:VOC family protein n=1 Tax=Streptomyces sp. NPDC057616 TaxID=3346183 RepID=UPI0036BFE439